jgi:hypothetical protein
MPANMDQATKDALNEVARTHGVDPAAVAAMVNLESRWSTTASTGSYHGLTQIGPQTFAEAGGKLGGMTYSEFLRAGPAQQIRAYGDYLNYYRFNAKVRGFGVDLSKMSIAQQAAYLQGFQLGPNAAAWQRAAASGQFNMPVTQSPQAPALGSTSLADMTRYYNRSLGAHLPIYASKDILEAAKARIDNATTSNVTSKSKADVTIDFRDLMTEHSRTGGPFKDLNIGREDQAQRTGNVNTPYSKWKFQ